MFKVAVQFDFAFDNGVKLPKNLRRSVLVHSCCRFRSIRQRLTGVI